MDPEHSAEMRALKTALSACLTEKELERINQIFSSDRPSDRPSRPRVRDMIRVPEEIGSFLRRAPKAGTVWPRDHARINHTDDLLFLALLLENCAEGWIEETRSPQGRYQYRAVTKPPHPMPKGSRFLKRATVRDMIRKNSFFDLRRMVADPNGHEIRLPQVLLKYPVVEGADPFDGIDFDNDFRSWTGVRPAPKAPKPRHILCPLCGPSPLIEVEVVSPPGTWQFSCGRVIESLACSGCLGEIQPEVTCMS
jgi:hypothetical protein